MRRWVTGTVLLILLACAGLANADTWDGGGDAVSFDDGLNWSLDVVPATAEINGAHTVTRHADVSISRTFVKNGATLNVTGGTHSDSRSGASIYNYVGDTGAGTVNHSAGSYNIGHGLRLGVGGGTGAGEYLLSGGGLIVSRGSNSKMEPTNPGGRPSMEVGDSNGGTGLFEISGGSFSTRGGVHVAPGGTFSVLGSLATSIGIGSAGDGDGTWIQKAGGTLEVGVDALGVTKILIDEVDGDGDQRVIFEAGSLLDVDHYNGTTNGGAWTVMELENGAITNNGLTFAPGVDTNIWSFNVDNSGVNGLLTIAATGTSVVVTNVTVDSIAELRQYADQDNMTVNMTPGTYWMTGDAEPRFLHLSGSNSTFNLTNVHIKVETAELPGYGSTTSVNVLYISGDGVTVDGLTLTMVKDPANGLIDAYGDPREYAADKSSQLVVVTGSDTVIRNCHLTTGGSYPYGYGDAFGKGARPNTGGVTDAAWIAHSKQSGFLITGGASNVVVDNVILNMRSYGHGFFMQQGAQEILFKDCQALGDTMADSDDILAHPEYQEWGFATYKEPIPADIRISKHEGAFRTYGNSDFASNGFNQWIENVTITNCLVERMRNGVAMGAHAGDLLVYDTELRECEMGFGSSAYGNTLFRRCKGDAVNGPLIYFQYSVDYPATYEVELTGATPGHGIWPISLISGADNRITLTSSAALGVYSKEAYVNTSQKWREWRHRPSGDIDGLSTGNYANYTTGNRITNLTEQILVFGPNATDNLDCVSTGGVINKGSDNTYTGETLVPAPIIVQDTWSYPPNSTNVPWAQYSGGELILPTPPYIVFDGTMYVDDAESLGGSPAGDGGTTVSNGTIEVQPELKLQGEDLLFFGTGTAGQGAVYSDGSPNNQTRLSSSSGVIALSGDTSIGVGISGNELLIGPIGGTGNLTKIGVGTLTMENGGNTFSGSLEIAEGWVKARSNKARNDVIIAAGAGLSQNGNLALNQGAAHTTSLGGTFNVNGRGAGDVNQLIANIGALTGGASGRMTSTSTAADQTVNVNSVIADSSYSGTIDGRIVLVKNGAGTTLSLNGTCTHTEGTFVNAGRLGGVGSIAGEVTVAGGAGIAPGTSVGTLTTGPQTWHGNAMLEIEVADTNGPAGTGWDLLVVNGAVTLDGSVSSGNPVRIDLSAPVIDFDARQGASWLIVDAASIAGGFSADKFTVDASAFAAGNPLEGGTFSVSESGGDLYLDFTPVPYTALEDWRFLHFGTYSNSGDAADGNDFEGDGRSNLIEYGTGSDPKGFDSNSVSTAGTTLDGSRFTITFNRIADPALTYGVDASTNLVTGGWNPIWSSTGPSNTVGPVTVEDTELMSDHGQRYLRMTLAY